MKAFLLGFIIFVLSLLTYVIISYFIGLIIRKIYTKDWWTMRDGEVIVENIGLATLFWIAMTGCSVLFLAMYDLGNAILNL